LIDGNAFIRSFAYLPGEISAAMVRLDHAMIAMRGAQMFRFGKRELTEVGYGFFRQDYRQKSQ
jgi:hypothetical protein